MWSAARCEATVFASDSPRTKREAVASSETKCLQIDKTADMMDTRSPTRGHDAATLTAPTVSPSRSYWMFDVVGADDVPISETHGLQVSLSAVVS